MSSVAVVILNWNGVDFMKKFIPGVVASCNRLSERLPGWTARTVVADNGSTDGSVEWMKGLGGCADTLFFDRNYGFTGGYNKVFRELGGKGFDYFLLLNSDIEVSDGWLAPLEEYIDTHPLCGACAPKLHSWSGRCHQPSQLHGRFWCRGRVQARIR